MVIDPAFSIYQNIEKNHPSNIFLTDVEHLLLFSHVIEQEIIYRKAHCTIYVGVQNFACLAPILHIYKRIAESAEQVYVLGKLDGVAPKCDPIRFIPLASDCQLAKEWFILVDHRDYTRVLSAQEFRPIPNGNIPRQFEAVLTSERKIAAHAIESLSKQLQFAKPS